MPSSSTWTIRPLLHAAGTAFTSADHAEGAVIYHQGDECDSVMYIERGHVRLAVTTRSGKEGICGLLGAGMFLGEEVLTGHAERRQTAIAMAATKVLVVPRAQMVELLHRHPAILDRFLTHLIERREQLEADLADHIMNSAEQRLARILLELAGREAHHAGEAALPRVSQAVIAEMVGTSRSRVNVFMSRFKRRGLIAEHGGVLHVQPALLHAVGD